jgi:rubredoxin
MQRPDEVKLSPQDGEALRTRLAGDALTADDRRVLDLVLQWYFWLLFALQEATFSLKRLRVLVFGERSKQRKPSHTDQASGSRDRDGRTVAQAVGSSTAASDSAEPAGTRRPGHGRWGAEAYSGATRVECRHEELTAGERCPVCGRGRLYRVAPGVDIRLDGHALLSAVHYVLEKFRCSACGQVFTAAAPAEAGADKYSTRARAVLVLVERFVNSLQAIAAYAHVENML